jgi:hypothetical protein
MKAELITLVVLLLSVTTPYSHGHGWSKEMRALLNAQTPDWLSIGKPIVVQPAEQNPSNAPSFREISGGTQSTGTKVTIPGRNIEIKVDYPITWWANGSSLSPDGTKLIINSGGDTHMLEIAVDGSYRPVELQLPKVTYDAGLKGFISSWFWAENDTLVGSAEIDNERGEFIEQRIYVFHPKQSILRRLDFSGLNLPSLEGLTVSKVGDDLNHLLISVGGKDFTVKADLHTPQSVEKQPEGATPSQQQPSLKSPSAPTTTEAKPSSTPSDEPASSTPWSIIVVLIVAAIGLLWLLVKHK